MQSNSSDCSATFSKCNRKECWNGGKRASQLSIDFEASELLLNLLKEKWSVLNDSKTSKKQVWEEIAIGLDEEGFLVRGEDKWVTCKTKWENLRRDYRSFISKFSQTGSGANDTSKKPKHFDQIEEILGEKNHSYRPVFIGDSFSKKQNPTKFKDTANKCKRDEKGLEKDLELPKEAAENENKGPQEDGSICKAEKEKCKKGRKRNSESEISDDDIYVDELDEEDIGSKIKKKRPSKATKSDKMLMAFKEMREERKVRHAEEKKEIQQRHTERMEKTQQLIDALKSMTPRSSSARARSSSRSPRQHRYDKRSSSGSSQGASKVGTNIASPRSSYASYSKKSDNYNRRSRSPIHRRSSSPPSSRSSS